MSSLTVVSLSEALDNMVVKNGKLVAMEVWLMLAMEVGHELMVTIVVTYNKEVVILVVDKVDTNKKQWKERKFSIFWCD